MKPFRYNVYGEAYDADGEETESFTVIRYASLRTALVEARCPSSSLGFSSIEPNASDYTQARWITFYGAPSLVDGERVNRSVHFPDQLKPNQRARLVRAILAGAGA